jgi:F0F1-type ATP synthase assembly protein I
VNNIIWMEMALIGASILIFRSVWAFLDSFAWASGRLGLAVLLIVGIGAAVVALRRIEALSGRGAEKAEDG